MNFSRARRLLASTVFISSIVALVACDGLDQHEWELVDRWLNCDECINGERDSVRLLGERAVPAISERLAGPTQARQQVVMRQFDDAYNSSGGGGASRAEYVTDLLSAYKATYQKRAALSLADIGGDKAQNALDDAIADTTSRGYRDDVVDLLQFLKVKLGTSPFGGSISPSVVAYGDTVTLTPSSGQPFTGTETFQLEDAPFPDSALVVTSVGPLPGQRKLVAAAGAGPRMVVIGNVGSAGTAHAATIMITSILDRNDRAMINCTTFDCSAAAAPEVTTASLPYGAFLTLWTTRPRSDTSDVFRIIPAVASTITARVDWVGSAPLDLRWRSCVPPFPDTPAGSAASLPNSRQISASINAGECRLLVVLKSTVTPNPVFARLRISTP
jgi:hypothetical protein